MIDLRTKTGAASLGIVLAVICAVSTALMAVVYSMTKAPIADLKQGAMSGNFRLILPEFDNDILSTMQEIEDGVRIYTAKKNGKVVAYAAEAGDGRGYGGQVTGLIGFAPDGRVLSYIVTAHNETPGLGTKAVSRIRQKTILSIFQNGKDKNDLPDNKLLDSFNGHSALESDSWKQPWTVKADGGNVDQISGATVSSRAAVRIAWKSADAVRKYILNQKGAE